MMCPKDMECILQFLKGMVCSRMSLMVENSMCLMGMVYIVKCQLGKV